MKPRVFYLQRDEDVTGKSGVGRVAWGIQFPDGKAALRWNTPTASTCAYDSVADVEEIHGHEGRTRVVFIEDLEDM